MPVIELRLGPVRACWTDRRGGVSAPPYDEANLSTRVGDDARTVHENRTRAAAATGMPAAERWWWLDQEHGRTTVTVEADPPPEPPVADAAVCAVPGIPLTVLTADCAPIVLACDDALGVVHAGWQGIAAGVIDEAVGALRSIGHGDVRAALGPCIHPDRYEFGRADLDALTARLGAEVEGRTSTGKPALDLPRAVTLALTRAGVRDVQDVGVCTAGSPDHFSHRRDGRTGRQALVAVLDP